MLARCTNLRLLHVRSKQFTEEGLSRLTALTKLTNLRLPSCIGDTGVKAIVQNHPQLQNLDLSYTQVTAASIDTLKQLRHLQRLAVVKTPLAADYRRVGVALQRALPDCEIEWGRPGLGPYDLFFE
jgi:Leucine-rich repeat (LRR) protein